MMMQSNQLCTAKKQTTSIYYLRTLVSIDFYEVRYVRLCSDRKIVLELKSVRTTLLCQNLYGLKIKVLSLRRVLSITKRLGFFP